MISFNVAFGQMKAVDEIREISINGLAQKVMIRGNDSGNPLLLILHGGPGFSEAMLFRSYNKDLEQNFMVVNWDQRGANLSYHGAIPPETMNIAQFVDDAKVLVDSLKKQFKQEKLFILGHSWGTVLGLTLASLYPDDFHAYISVCQMVHGISNEKQSLDYTLKEASKRNNEMALHELRQLSENYPFGNTLKSLKEQREWLLKFGGVFYGGMDYAKLFKNVDRKEAHLYHPEAASKGEQFSMEHLWEEILQVDFFSSVQELKVPAYFLVGDSDYNTPHTLTKKYYNHLRAPKKELIRFRRSGHFIPFEEPEKFTKVLEGIRYKVLPEN